MSQEVVQPSQYSGTMRPESDGLMPPPTRFEEPDAYASMPFGAPAHYNPNPTGLEMP
jgi:hypothetical protein